VPRINSPHLFASLPLHPPIPSSHHSRHHNNPLFFARRVPVSEKEMASSSELMGRASRGSSDDWEVEEEEDDDVVVLGRDDVSDFNEENVLPQTPEVLNKIRSWLHPTDYDSEGGEYKKHAASHLVGTGTWLFSSEMYREWHASQDRGMLWIRGMRKITVLPSTL